MICFPPHAIMNERYIHIGSGTMIGAFVTLSAGMVPGQRCVTDPVVSIGDRCLIGQGSGIVGHLRIEVGDDVWTGHNVYITDQNHGYDDPTRADLASGHAGTAGRASAAARGWGSARSCSRAPTIGEHVVIGANSVVTGVDPVVRGRGRFAGAGDQGDGDRLTVVTARVTSASERLGGAHATASRCRRRTYRSVR